ncbi:MAG: S24 family peptidase [Flavobacteriales bacterium]
MIIDNIYKYLDYKGITVYEISKRIGISNGYLAKTRQNRGNVGGQVLEKIVIQCPEINPAWLLTGKGEMLLKDSDTSKVEKPAAGYGKTQPTITKSKGVPYYDVDFIGGFDLVFNNQSITPSFYIDFSPFNGDTDYWVNVSGDSMKPLISHGDIVALKKFESWRDFVLYGEMYAIVTDDFRTIKTVGKGGDIDHLSLIPHNKSEEFSNQDIPKRLIRHMFKVKGSIKKFF